MENKFSSDISLRNLSVRPTSNEDVGCEVPSENVGCFTSHSSKEELSHCPDVRTFDNMCDEEHSPDSKDISEELKDKLQLCCTSDTNANSGLLNGCNKSFYDGVRCIDCVDFNVNGLTKCNAIDRINAHFDHCWSDRTCPRKFQCDEIQRTERSVASEDLEQISKSSACTCSYNHKTLSVGNSVIEAKFLKENVKNGCDVVCQSTKCDTLMRRPKSPDCEFIEIKYVSYESERQMPDIMRLIQKDLSEPYSIYTYRYFIHNWPKLCFLAQDGDKCVGAIVCKLDVHKKHSRRGYIAMLAVDENYRKRKIGSNLVLKAIHAMIKDNADEVVLETEITNKPALRLYENLGFVRDKRLFRYYLNGVDALRLKLWLR